MMTHRSPSQPSPQAGPAPEASAHPEARAPAETGQSAAGLELEDRLRRALADLDNVRKRCERQLAQERAAERARVAAVFLPVIDNLDLALEHAGSDPGAVVEGVRAVRDQAVAVLSAMGFARREETGVPFDPMRHEAVSVVPGGEQDPGTVLHVVRPGYGDSDRQSTSPRRRRPATRPSPSRCCSCSTTGRYGPARSAPPRPTHCCAGSNRCWPSLPQAEPWVRHPAG